MLLKENNEFINILTSQNNCLEIIMPILHILLKSPHKFINHLCLYILLRLSESRKFCVLLNTKLLVCHLDLPLFTGNYADLLINAFTKLIFLKNTSLVSSYNLILSIVSNFSAYIKALAPISSHNIVKLLQEFSLKSWVETSDPEQEMIIIILGIINNLIQYQWRGSGYIVH